MDVFKNIIEQGKWQLNGGSLCGPGSDIENARGAFTAVMQCLRMFKPQTILDLACGDGNWIHHFITNDVFIHYHGIDYVDANLATFRKLIGNKTATLQQGDISTIDLPKADMVILRDTLIHMPYEHGTRIIENIKRSGSTFLLTTTYPNAQKNFEIKMDGDWYPININLPPYNLQPMMIFYDGYANIQKYLALILIDQEATRKQIIKDVQANSKLRAV
jgi:SAM-dependent methyltransferase